MIQTNSAYVAITGLGTDRLDRNISKRHIKGQLITSEDEKKGTMPDNDIHPEMPDPDSLSDSAVLTTTNTDIAATDWLHKHHLLHMQIQDPRWQQVMTDDLAQRFWTMIDAFACAPVHFTCLCADKDMVRQMNHSFRDQDKATNVLSFPDGEIDHETGKIYLGDILLCWDVMAKEAADQGLSLADHSLHLMLHGLLHLLGYDHIDDQEAAEMEMLETRLLQVIAIANPYADEVVQ